MDNTNTKRMGLVTKMLELIDECGGPDSCRKVLMAACAVRDIRVSPPKKVSMSSSDVEEECEEECEEDA